MTSKDIDYDPVQTTGELGRLVRAHRKQRGLTLETLSGLGNPSVGFLSGGYRSHGSRLCSCIPPGYSNVYCPSTSFASRIA